MKIRHIEYRFNFEKRWTYLNTTLGGLSVAGFGSGSVLVGVGGRNGGVLTGHVVVVVRRGKVTVEEVDTGGAVGTAGSLLIINDGRKAGGWGGGGIVWPNGIDKRGGKVMPAGGADIGGGGGGGIPPNSNSTLSTEIIIRK